MKFICYFLFSSLFVGTCSPVYFSNNLTQDSNANLNHQYQGVSNANTESTFSLIDRKIEIEFASIVEDSLADVLIMLTSGYNEGEIVDHMYIHLKDGTEMKVFFTSQISREYVASYNYNSSLPVSRTKTINDPGGVDLVVQPDGTHQHVHRPASSKTVTVNETETQTNSIKKSQLFNSATIELNQDEIKAIKNTGIDRFEVLLENCEIDIAVSSRKNKAILKRI